MKQSAEPPLPAANRLAMVSLFLGVVSYLLVFIALVPFIFPWLGSRLLVAMPPLTAIGAIATGHIARGQIRRNKETGSRRATTGLLLGYLMLLIVIIGVFVLINSFGCVDNPSPECR